MRSFDVLFSWRIDDNNKHMTKIDLTHVVKVLKFELINVTAKVKQIGPG